jgi:hypothetical protein
LFGLYEVPQRGRFSHAAAACHRAGKDIVLPHLMPLQVRFCQHRFSPTGELDVGAVG